MQIPSFLLQLLGHMLVYLLFKERFFIVYARLSFWAASWTKSWDQKHRKSKLQVVGPPPCGSQAGRAWWEFSVSGAAVCAGPGSRFWGSFWGLFLGPFLGPVLGRFSGLVNSGLIGGAKFDSKTGPKVDPKSDPKIGPVSGPVPAQTAGSSWIFRLVSRAGGRKRPAKPARIPCGSQAGRAWWEFSVSGAAVCAGPGSRFWGSFWGLFLGPFLGPVLGRFSGLVNSGLIGGAKFDSKTGPKVDPKSDPKIGPVSGPVPAQTAGSSWIFRLVSRAGGRKRPAKPARILRRTWDLKRRFFHFRGLVLGPSARPRAGPGSTLFVTVLPLSASTPAGGPKGFLVQAI